MPPVMSRPLPVPLLPAPPVFRPLLLPLPCAPAPPLVPSLEQPAAARPPISAAINKYLFNLFICRLLCFDQRMTRQKRFVPRASMRERRPCRFAHITDLLEMLADAAVNRDGGQLSALLACR